MKTSRRVALVAVAVSFGLAACSGPRAFTRGTYEDPNTIEMLSDHFNENDLQLIAKKMVESLAGSKAVTELQGRPVIVVGKLKNSTSEHIDMRSLGDKISVNILKTGKFKMQDKAAREDIAEEYEYQGSGYVEEGKAKGPGQQASADYVLTGDMASIIQQVGDDKLVYYKFTLRMNNLKTGETDWIEEKEIRKKFEKKGISF